MFVRTFFCALLLICSNAWAKEDGSEIQPDNLFPRVKLETSMGNIVIELDRYKSPLTANNFLRYVVKKSYDDTIFHRIVPDFVVQGGGYAKDFNEQPKFGNIFNESGNGNKNAIYTVAMARQNDPHSANRQFFFNLKDNDSLNPGKDWGYAVFAVVVDGMDVIDKMAEVETHYDAQLGWNDVPVKPVFLKTARLLPQQ